MPLPFYLASEFTRNTKMALPPYIYIGKIQTYLIFPAYIILSSACSLKICSWAPARKIPPRYAQSVFSCGPSDGLTVVTIFGLSKDRKRSSKCAIYATAYKVLQDFSRKHICLCLWFAAHWNLFVTSRGFSFCCYTAT